jgi:hypothetical protein
MQIVKEFYQSGNLRFLAEVDGRTIVSLRHFKDEVGKETEINKSYYKCNGWKELYIVPIIEERLKNKITIRIDGSRLIVGREINRPTPPNPAGWHRVFMLNWSGFGSWKNTVWIKGIWESNLMGEVK